MKVRHLALALASAAGLQFAAAPAHALPAYALMAPSFALAAMQSLDPCTGSGARVQSFVKHAASSSLSKSSAILGGQVSQLEMVARQQAAVSTPALARANVPDLITGNIEPGAIGRCRGFVARRTLPQAPGLGNPVLGPDDFLASKRVAVQRTSFDQSWSRVRNGNVSRKFMPKFGNGVASKRGLDILGAVNSWTNDHVRYVEDRVLYQKADYWADAASTLKRGAGDCEDIAIAKMQLLARMGVSRSDMYLTIARDTVRNTDH